MFILKERMLLSSLSLFTYPRKMIILLEYQNMNMS